MCGIIGFVGKSSAIDVLLDGLKTLEYRGYDSAGIAIIAKNKVDIIKQQGKISELEKIIDKNIKSNLGIAHTRWATHGKPSVVNAHPFKINKITIVHNGIIENYNNLKDLLIDKGYSFKSETDSEIACGLIDYLYQKNNNLLKSLVEFKKMVRGSYALAVICDDELNCIYTIRKDSPLIIAKGDNSNYIASDVPAILKYTNKYILLDTDEIGKVSDSNITIYDDKLNIKEKEVLIFEGKLESAMKNGFEHFMLKEIHEEPEVVIKTLKPYMDNVNSLIKNMPDFDKYNKIDIVACGSAYHTGLVAKTLIEEFADICVNVEIASEYRYKKVFIDEKTLVIFVSQSGETADTLASLRKINDMGIDTLAIVNVIGSSIAREAKNVLYIKAGPEISVATTKAYSAQVALLSLIALNMSKNNLAEKDINNVLDSIDELPNLMNKLINNNQYSDIAKDIYKYNDIFFIGRGIDYCLCLEGSLKLKEISYIHSEAYPAGELKHGTISLIEENTPVISIITDNKLEEKTINNIKEVKARGAKVVLISNSLFEKKEDYYDHLINIPRVNKFLQPILTIIPLQLIAYEVAKLRGCDIDKPKNLAKSVTVE